MRTSHITLFLVAIAIAQVHGGPCPDMSELDVMLGDTFRCAHSWYGPGHPDPSLACNPFCQTSGEDPGVPWVDGQYVDSSNPYYKEVGSLYVWPGCTVTAYDGYVYSGNAETFQGPYNGYKMSGPISSSNSNCANGWRSFKCLCVQKPIECYPTDFYGNVLLCDNSYGITPVTCTYQQQVGTTYSESAQESMHVSQAVESSIKVGFRNLFSAQIGVSTSTGYDWTQSTSNTWNEVITQTLTASAPPGAILHIDQVVGMCEDNITRPPVFKTYHTNSTTGQLIPESVKIVDLSE